MKYIFTEKALEDVVKHSLKYEETQEGLGVRFLKAVDESAEAISIMPEGYVNSYKNTRECRTKIFPFKLIYTIEEKMIYIHAVYPCKADPKKKYKNVKK